MLLRFGVANHRSIRDYQEMLLTASRPHGEGLATPVVAVDASVVPVAALYGANASGKSNLLDAMDDLRLMVALSHTRRDASDPIRRFPFRLDADSRQKPTRFECSFTTEGSPCESASCEAPAYDLEVEFTDSEVRHERLRRSIRGERRSTHTLYSRETKNGSVEVDFGVRLHGENQVTANVTRPNSLFLSAAAQNNHPQLTEVHKWFSQNWHCMLSEEPMNEWVAAKLVADHRYRDWLDRLLKQAEKGIVGIELDEEELDERTLNMTRDIAAFVADHIDGDPNPRLLADELADSKRRRVRLLHESAAGLWPLDYASESRGTRMFLTLVLPALEALASGSLLVIDELDSSLHPRLAQAFVSLFMRPESNPHGSQLIFSTHDVALLGAKLLAQDEIWLVDKNTEGVSSLTPLTDFRLRGDVERAYRNGRLGGSPDLHSFFLDLTAQP